MGAVERQRQSVAQQRPTGRWTRRISGSAVTGWRHAFDRPAIDVGRAPVHRVRLDVEDVVVGGRHPDQVAAGGVDDALGWAVVPLE
jgi:hypothetical protein